MNLLPNIRQEIGRGRGGRRLEAPAFAQCQAAELPGGVFPTDGGWARGSEHARFLFLDVMPSSHTPFGPWQKTGSREKDLAVQIAPHLTRKMSDFGGLLQRGGFFVVFLVAVAQLWQQRCFWYVVRTQIDLGSWSTVFLKT